MAGRAMTLTATNTPVADLALTNLAYCCPSDLHSFTVPSTKLFLVFVADCFDPSLSPHDVIRPGRIALIAI